jgi:gluconate 5-dehydrogenase
MLTSKNLFDLNGKIALVAGSSRGIGFALANALKENGAYVIGLSREPNKKNFLSEHYICDVTKKSNIEDILTKLIRNKIKIDIVIFAAGISSVDNVTDEYEKFVQVLNTNLLSNFNLINTLKPILNKNSSIINISSINSIQGFPGNPGYVASKGGVEALTRSLAIDLSDDKIRVNCIRPGYIITDMTINSYNNKKQNLNRKNRTILNRWGKTEDLIGPMLLLASNASLYMTGSIITVDGGWTALGLST